MAAFQHTGAAASLIKNLKYRGADGIAGLVAERLSGRLPALPLVPVPRAMSRYLRYGVDPADVLATALGKSMGVPVMRLLARPVHTSRRAGRNRSKPAFRFDSKADFAGRVILVDDVVTTGATLCSAAGALGTAQVGLAVAANDALLQVSMRV